jgi:hypothetical protein
MSRARLLFIGAGSGLLALVAGWLFNDYQRRDVFFEWSDSASAAPAPAAAAAVTPVKPAAPAVLAEAVNQDPPVTVQVVAAKRATPDTLRVDLMLVSRSTAPGAVDLSLLAKGATSAPDGAGALAAVRAGSVAAGGAGGSSHAAHGATSAPAGPSVADLCLLTSDGTRRLFALRDADDKPVGGGDFAPLGPGERRAVWVLFPAPPAGDTRVTLLVGGLTLQNIQISADSGRP